MKNKVPQVFTVSRDRDFLFFQWLEDLYIWKTYGSYCETYPVSFMVFPYGKLSGLVYLESSCFLHGLFPCLHQF